MIIIYKIKKRKMENFEFELIKNLNSENQKENFVISPLGLELVLSLCSNGAEGTTQKEIINLLKYKNIEEVNNNTKEENKNEGKEIILKEGELEKKSPYWHYNTRKVILYSTPKIVYIDPSNNKVKGEIYLDKSSKVIHVSTNVFEIVSPKRNFKFKSPDALVWEKFIADAIKKYGK